MVEDGLYEHLGKQGLPVGIQEGLEKFHRGCVGYLSRHLFPGWDSLNGESELATAGTTTLLVELIGVAV